MLISAEPVFGRQAQRAALQKLIRLFDRSAADDGLSPSGSVESGPSSVTCVWSTSDTAVDLTLALSSAASALTFSIPHTENENKLGMIARDAHGRYLLCRQRVPNVGRLQADPSLPFFDGAPELDVIRGRRRIYYVVAPLDDADHKSLANLQTLLRAQIGLSPETASPTAYDDQAQTEIERNVRLGEVSSRPGQQKFSALIRYAYGGRCAITECSTAVALEAAHIRVRDGADDNSAGNGILLRRDIHALFDSLLITLSEDGGGLVVSERLDDPSYAYLRTAVVRRPAHGPGLSPQSIADHRRRFEEQNR